MGTFLGATTRVTMALDDGTEVKAEIPSHDMARFPVAAKVAVALAPRPVLVTPR